MLEPTPAVQSTAVYTRVSSAENKPNLDSQAERLVASCTVRGYQVSKVVKEIGSGVNDNRPKFLALLADPNIKRIVIEHKDRGTRFGFRSIETLLKTYGREIEVVNQAENSTEDLLADLTLCETVRTTASQTEDRKNCAGIGGARCSWLSSM